MKKAAAHISGVLKAIIFIGFSIQIILGIIWMCFHFAHLQQFEQAEGILYRGIRAVSGEGFPLLYVLQLIVGYVAADRFFREIYPTAMPWRIFRNLGMLTFPMAMQCHLAVSPYSLTSSLVLLELSAAVSVVRNPEQPGVLRKYAAGGLYWLVSALLLPEYFLLGALPLVFAVLFRAKTLLKKLGFMILLLAAFGGIIVGVHALSGDRCLPDKEEAAFSLLNRVAWPTLYADSAFWPEEVREAVSGHTWDASMYADNMQKLLHPVLRENFSDEQLVEYYGDMILFSWRQHAPVIVRQVGWDILGYGVTPLILPLQLEGEAYASYSGRNYEFMFIHSPKITKYYVRYSCWWFAAAAVLSVLLGAGGCLRRTVKLRLRDCAALTVCVIFAGSAVLLYSLRGAGVMDYKCTVAVNLLWLAAIWLAAGRSETVRSTEG